MSEPSPLSAEEIAEIINSLLQKEGKWVDWGRACQILHKSGCSPQKIFEETGFQASHQNLIIVAAQVYESLVKQEASEDLLSYYSGPKSDILYELRILDHEHRLPAAQTAKDKSLELEDAHDMAKAFQEFCRLTQIPFGFTRSPGDAVAYQCWKRARQKKDLQERSRLIARGLKFAYSPAARTLLEQLLTDFTITSSKSAPLLPICRLEETEEMSRILPLVGSLPFSWEKLKNVPKLRETGAFKVVNISSNNDFVSLPGWNVLIKAEDPVALLVASTDLPRPISSKIETVLAVVDRASTIWEDTSYYLTLVEEKLELLWFAEFPTCQLLGKLLLIVRPKNILDEDNITQPWQMDD
jgi:hypothetical protein